MAKSDHCSCVSTPRCVRTSWKVTSTCQRITNYFIIYSGLIARSVQSTASGSKTPLGSRIKTQRKGSAGMPLWNHTATSETISTSRRPPPIPIWDRHFLPGRFGISQHLRQSGQQGTFLPRPSFLAFFARRSRAVEGCIQVKASDHTDRVGELGDVPQKFDDGRTGIRQNHQLSAGQPTISLVKHLAGSICQSIRTQFS